MPEHAPRAHDRAAHPRRRGPARQRDRRRDRQPARRAPRASRDDARLRVASRDDARLRVASLDDAQRDNARRDDDAQRDNARRDDDARLRVASRDDALLDSGRSPLGAGETSSGARGGETSSGARGGGMSSGALGGETSSCARGGGMSSGAAASMRAGDRHWSPEMEAVARRTLRQANGYAWMYESMASSAKVWGDNLNIISGMLGGAVGTAGIVSLITDQTTPVWVRAVQVVLGFCVATVSALISTWRLSEAQMNDVLTHVSYASLARDIMCQLAQPRKDRQDAREYIKAKLSEIEQLKISAPVVGARARAKYNAKFKNNPIYSPEDAWEATMADAQHAVMAANLRGAGFEAASLRGHHVAAARARAAPLARAYDHGAALEDMERSASSELSFEGRESVSAASSQSDDASFCLDSARLGSIVAAYDAAAPHRALSTE